MRPIAGYAASLRLAMGRTVPDADPADGGADASVLLLLERPGRGVAPAGFVSRDNATPTARNIRRFSETAGIVRTSMLIWNVVPWLDEGALRERPPKQADIMSGLRLLPDLLALLPRLCVVVLSGRVAGMARETVSRARPEVRVLAMPHPSPTIVCTDPRIGERIAGALAEAAAIVGGCEPERQLP